MKILKRSFFSLPADEAAPQLLGCELVHETPNGPVSGRIIETEAYLGRDDPACHAARGKTPRNAPMFERGGVSYVYFIYGMYHCFNVVTGPEGSGEAVLIRAVEPVQGIDRMSRNRGRSRLKDLCSGPGKLCIALEITPDHNLHPLNRRPLYIRERPESFNSPIARSGRIGINAGAELQLRFYLSGHSGLSRPG